MTQELTFTLYLLIGAFGAIAFLAFAGWSLWREIASLDTAFSYDNHVAETERRYLAREIEKLTKRVETVEAELKDLNSHANLVTDWIKAATDKIAD